MNEGGSRELSRSLEDYLETIYELVRDHKVARVKEIAKLRDVKPGSVSPAMKRLSDLGLIRYEQREYIDLTPAGEREAKRVIARHKLLTRLFNQHLGMGVLLAEQDACLVEHCLSEEAMGRLRCLMEFLDHLPQLERRRLDSVLDAAFPAVDAGSGCC